MNDFLSMVGYALAGFSPIVGGLLVFFAIAYVGHRHDQRIELERKRQAFLLLLKNPVPRDHR